MDRILREEIVTMVIKKRDALAAAQAAIEAEVEVGAGPTRTRQAADAWWFFLHEREACATGQGMSGEGWSHTRGCNPRRPSI